jgi:hypothetical protein
VSWLADQPEIRRSPSSDLAGTSVVEEKTVPSTFEQLNVRANLAAAKPLQIHGITGGAVVQQRRARGSGVERPLAGVAQERASGGEHGDRGEREWHRDCESDDEAADHGAQHR